MYDMVNLDGSLRLGLQNQVRRFDNISRVELHISFLICDLKCRRIELLSSSLNDLALAPACHVQMIRLSLDKILDFIILPLIRLGSQGVKGTLKFMACPPRCHAIVLLICSLGLLVTGTVAEPQNYKDDIQKW
jgi:hypothetical protein